MDRANNAEASTWKPGWLCLDRDAQFRLSLLPLRLFLCTFGSLSWLQISVDSGFYGPRLSAPSLARKMMLYLVTNTLCTKNGSFLPARASDPCRAFSCLFLVSTLELGCGSNFATLAPVPPHLVLFFQHRHRHAFSYDAFFRPSRIKNLHLWCLLSCFFRHRVPFNLFETRRTLPILEMRNLSHYVRILRATSSCRLKLFQMPRSMSRLVRRRPCRLLIQH